jgi:hypothetical protein
VTQAFAIGDPEGPDPEAVDPLNPDQVVPGKPPAHHPSIPAREPVDPDDADPAA